MFQPVPHETDAVAAEIIEAAFQVHRALGPGLLESVYETCLCHQLAKQRVPFERQVSVPVVYDGVRLETVRSVGRELCDRGFWAGPQTRRQLMSMVPEYRLSKFQRVLPDKWQVEMVGGYLLDFGGVGSQRARVHEPEKTT